MQEFSDEQPTSSSDNATSTADRSDTGFETDPFHVVGIGASAQGLEALKAFVGALPDEPGMAFVIVQHLAPDHPSNLDDLLENATDLRVVSADDATRLEVDHIYVISPGDQLSIEEGRLRTERLPDLETERHTIDFFCRSLAETIGHRAIGILLSGAGTDGTTGLRLIKQHGGLTMAQEPAEAGVDMMPQSAIEADVVDVVSRVDALPDKLVEVTAANRRFGPPSAPEVLDERQIEALATVMALLRERTGNDLSEYKRPTVLRRIGRRMQVLRIDSIEEYVRHLESESEEIDALVDELLIKVTRFFRDREAWEALRDSVIPQLFEDKTSEDEIRVWVPGCATGEEAYTIALLLHRHAESLEDPPEIKVFATDIDHEAVRTARAARYPRAVASDLPEAYLERYFRTDGDHYRVVKEVRNHVLFAAQNALTDPPFSNLDLVTCRNLLIYLQPDAQTRLLRLFYYGLDPDGILMLGGAESVSQTPDLFESVDESHPVYRARQGMETPVVVPGTAFGFDSVASAPDGGTAPVSKSVSSETGVDDIGQLHREALAKSYDLASVLVDDQQRLLHTIGDVGPYLSVPAGKPTDDLFEMLSDRLRPMVRTALFEALGEDAAPTHHQIPADSDAGRPAIQLRATPLDRERFGGPVVELSFRPLGSETSDLAVDASEGADDEDLLESYDRELEKTRRQLQTTIREYEATNDDLRASNEELMSMNEELQSTTEELETSKEELQSMNEELQTVNDELNDKIRELDALNSDLRNLLRSTDIGTIFLDRDFTIKRYTDPVTGFFNLLPSDQGRPFDHVTHSLDTDRLLEDAGRALEELATVEREVESDDGRYFLVRTLPYLTVDDRVDGVVLTFIDVTERRRIQNQLAESEKKFRTIFESAADPMFIYRVGPDGRPEPFLEANGAAADKLALSHGELEEKSLGDILDTDRFDLQEHLARVAEKGEAAAETTMSTVRQAEPIPVETRSKHMEIEGTTVVVEIVRDITDRKRYEETLIESKERAEELAELRSMFLSTLSHDVRSPLTAITTMVGVLRRKLEADDGEMLDRIERAAQQLRKILDSILRMAKLESKEISALAEDFEMVAKIEEVLDLYEPLADNEGLTLTYKGPESPVEVTLDPRFLTQILNNLVDNALKYTDEGGISIRLQAGDDRIVIEVADTGCGIPEQERELIFERFETTSERAPSRYDSIGLGLAISRLLVESMDGEISVESTPDEGSTFTVELPRTLER